MTEPSVTRVNCEGCRACCKGQLVTLEAGENPADYAVDTITGPSGVIHVLKHQANGDCVYLGPDGCTIYGWHPVVCRAFDCVVFAAEWTRARRRRMNMKGWDPVLKAGQARLRERQRAERMP